MSIDVELLEMQEVVVFDTTITHNLGKMATECGVYTPLWRPEELNVTRAKHLIPYLEEGIQKLKSDPEHYKNLDSPNGWGTYEDFLPWLEKLLRAAKEHPEAKIEVSV